MAGITTPFTTPVFPFLQTVSQRTLDNIVPAFTLADGPQVAPIPLTPDAGLGQGVFAVDRDLGVGLRAAVERVGAARAHAEHRGRGRLRRVEDHPRRHPRREPESADRRAAGARATSLLTRVPNPYFGIIPRSSSLGDPTIPRAQLLKPYPEYTTVSLYRNNVGTTHLSRLLRQARAALLAGPLVSRQLHAVEADGRRLVGVRCVDPDRTGRELPGRRQLQPRARARLLDRRHPARVRGVGGLGPAVRRRTGAVPPTGRCSARSSTTGRSPACSRCSRVCRLR